MAAFGVWVAGGAGGERRLGGACSSWLLRRGRGFGGGGGGRCVFGARRNKVAFAVSVGWVRAVCLIVRRSQWLMSWKNIGVER